MEIEITNKERRDRLLLDAKWEKSHLKAMKELAKGSDDCVATLTIEGVEHAFSSAQVFLSVIDAEIKEINKAINGKNNKWE